ncbi:putative membrane protein [Wickerhamomyces ciferrii]|uniref:Membrane protein n=1 Tax=Wickerhamomyces ciferrii (strain ATCC 14091 / BCRC 22168 / CBS 111 / JCM 3599 / NBRC 0793 / NRRL Y-1031 F-60-10) TaxID=1206466 RepID=K0KUB9_WICCF|nr:uncharacterized protein BN7_4608 [Wickerhamomyces ciferrii]CCH45029.1 putative membrane protein [Wickerhamomyces ciferrii]
MEVTPIIPQDSLRDTLALTVLLISTPQPISTAVLVLYILFSSSKLFVSKLFTKVFKNQVQVGNNGNGNAATTNTNTETSPSPSFSPPTSHTFTLILLFDLTLGALLKSTAPNITKLIHVLSKSIIANQLCGNQFENSILSSLSIIFLDHFFKILVQYIDSNFGITISNSPNLFPYLSNHANIQFSSFYKKIFHQLTFKKSNQLSFIQFNYLYLTEFCWHFINYIMNYANLLLSIHIILMAFASQFKKNPISKSINQFTNDLNNTNQSTISSSTATATTATTTTTNNNNNTTNNINTINNNNTESSHFLEIKIPKDLASHQLNFDEIEDEELNDQLESKTPASYPDSFSKTSNINQDELVSSSTIVAENFEIFVNSSFNKPKNNIKSIQPLWSLMATARSMSSRKDIYSGEIDFLESDDNNSLVLSDYTNNYDDYKFKNFTNSIKSKIMIFINYIGETLISFQLKNYSRGLIFVRVNGVIWYQVSRGEFQGEEFFIVGGLTPSSQYDIQFIIENEDEFGLKRKWLVDDLIVSTTDRNGESLINSKNLSSTSNRVLSPLVTLQESLITTNDNLIKEKLKLKKTRKEISKKLNSYKTDIENLKNKISNSDKNDEKNWKKVLSLRNSVKQVEEENSKIETKIQEIEIKELEINEIYLVEKRKFDNLARNFNNFKNQFNEKLTQKTNILKDLSNELDLLITKNEKLSNKFEKLQKDYFAIDKEISKLIELDLNHRFNERSIRASKRESLLDEFKKEIDKMQEGLRKLTNENEFLTNSINV